MNIHVLKCWPESFAQIVQRKKHFEIRQNDRDFQEGDLLELRCWNPATAQYTGEATLVRVGLIYHGEWGLPRELCVMDIAVVGDPAEVAPAPVGFFPVFPVDRLFEDPDQPSVIAPRCGLQFPPTPEERIQEQAETRTLIHHIVNGGAWEFDVHHHPATEACPQAECLTCGARDCPHGEPLHYHHDGCPACSIAESRQGQQA